MGRKDKKEKKSKKDKQARPKKPTLARRADKHVLYQKSVQEPDADIPLIQKAFRTEFGRTARTLREDFCGTALLACRWVETHRKNHAWGIDLDPDPLDWGREHNLARLEPSQAARVKLIEGDVLDIGHEKVDVTVAFNFSYFLFRQRESLRNYFERAFATLDSEGLLILDVYGGADAQRTCEEQREVDGDFDYVWDQDRFDPIHHHATNFIHFRFRDGSEIKRAFRYDWRLWTLPEIQELLAEAGFFKSTVYWEGTDRKTGEGNDVFSPRETAPDDPAWIAYVVAARR